MACFVNSGSRVLNPVFGFYTFPLRNLFFLLLLIPRHQQRGTTDTDVIGYSPPYLGRSASWLLHLQATHAKKTQQYSNAAVLQSPAWFWAIQKDVPLSGFGKRHMDCYLVSRAETGKVALALYHDAICAKAFFHWCQKSDIFERSLLADYPVRHAPRPAQYMPTGTDRRTLVGSVHDCWNPQRKSDRIRQ